MKNSDKKNVYLKRVNFVITKVCNLHCRMCDIPELNFWGNDLPLSKIKGIAREAAELGAEMFELSGGEPMTRKDVYEIICYAASLGLEVFMVTNGVLIGPSEAEKLIEAGLTKISFSLEGPENLNDQIRGEGNFRKTLNAIQSFSGYSSKIPELQVMVGITLSRRNYKLICSFSKYLLEDVGVYSISINPFNGAMMARESLKARGDEFNIPAELIPDLTCEIEQLAQYSDSVPGKLPPSRYLRRIPGYFAGEKQIPPGGCRIPQTFCGISTQGYVFPCWHSPSIGDLRRATLYEILTSDEHEKSAKQALSGRCSGCLSSCYIELF